MGGRNRQAERRAVELMRAAVLAWYGEACACCGATDDLGIEHVNGDGRQQREALFGLNQVSGRFYRWLIEHGFPDDPPLQVHCRPCNSSKGTGPACRLDHGKDQVTRRREAANAAQAAWRARHGTARSVSTKPGTVGGRILAYLAEHGPSQSSAIAAALEVSPGSAAANLTGLLKAGHVERPAHGVYCLPGQEPRQAGRARVYEPGPEGWHGGHDWAAGTTWTTERCD